MGVGSGGRVPWGLHRGSIGSGSLQMQTGDSMGGVWGGVGWDGTGWDGARWIFHRLSIAYPSCSRLSC